MPPPLPYTTRTLSDFTVSNGGTIIGGQTVNGTISSNTELDLYSMVLTAGTTYQFTVLGEEWATATGQTWTLDDPFLYISGPSGSGLFVTKNDDGGSGLNTHLYFTPTVSGTYGVGVWGWGDTGTYQLTAGYRDDIGSSTASFANMGSDTSFDRQAEIGAVGDHDWFKVSLAANTTYTIRVDSCGGDGSFTSLGIFDPFVRVRDASGVNILAQDDDGANLYGNSLLAFTTGASPATYYLDVGAYGERSTGSYILHLIPAASPWDDAGASTASYRDITAMPEREYGSIQFAGDHDWLRVQLTAGATYTFDALGSDTMDGELADPYMALRGAGGAVITQADSGGLGNNARITYTATSTGYYFIDVSSSGGIGTGGYHLNINNSSSSWSDANNTDFLLLAPGQYSNLMLSNSGEVAIGTIYCQSGQAYTLAANRYGAPGGSGGLNDPYLQIYDSTGGTLLWSNDNNGVNNNALINFTATSTGYHQVRVGGTGSSTGRVQLFFNSGSSATLDDIGNTTTNRALTALGKTSHGTIDSTSDHDWFAIALTAGVSYRFTVTPDFSVVDGLMCGNFTLRNAAGAQLQDVVGFGCGSTYLTYAPTASGTYYIDVRGYGTYTGHYTLNTVQSGATDIGSSTALFGEVSPQNIAVGSTLETASDHDWYRVFLEAGRTFTFHLRGADSGYGTLLDPRLVLRNQFGVQVAVDENSGQGLDSRLRYAVTRSGYYFLDAGSYSNHYAGAYTLQGTYNSDDYGGATATAGYIPGLGLSMPGELESRGDSDWFQINLSPGTYVFNAAGEATGYGTLRDPMVALRNAAGTLLARDDNGGTGLDSRLSYTVTTAGVYYVEVNAYLNGYSGTYTVVAGPLDDYGSSTSSYGSVMFMGHVTGKLETATDRDWFSFTLGSSGTYTFNVDGLDTGAGTLLNPMVTLRNASGVALASDNDAGVGRNARLTRALTAGTYYLDVSSFGAGSAGSYQVSVDAQDDHGASTATAGAIGLGADNAVSGALEADGDHDWYQVYLPVGGYVFELQGAGSGLSTLADPLLALRNASGGQVAVDDNTGSNLDSRLAISVSAAGWYFLDVGAYANAYAGSYRLLATTTGSDDYGASIANTGITGPTLERAVRGVLETAGDHDWFRVSLAAGVAYTFDVEGLSTGQGTLYDPFLTVRNAAGAVLFTNDNSGIGLNAQSTYTPTAAGYYYLDVGSFSERSAGGYRVTVNQASVPPDDFGVTAGSSGLLGLGAEETARGCIEINGDHDWFRISLVNGQQYTFDLKGYTANGGSLSTAYVSLCNAAGSVITGGGPGIDSQLSWTATATGNYYLDVQSLGPTTGSYTLTATTGANALDDCGQSTAAYAITGVGRGVQGFLERGADRDWYAIYLDSGNTYTFNLGGYGSHGGSLVNPALVLRNASGAALTSNDNYNDGSHIQQDARITYAATASGWYFLDAFSSATNNGSGSYTLSAALGTAALDDFGASTSSFVPVAVGTSVNGSLENRYDRDWFRVSLTAGQSYTFDAWGASSANGSLSNPYLTLRSATGLELTSDEDSGSGTDARISYTCTSSGNYFLEVSGYDASTTGGGYVFSASVAGGGLGSQGVSSWLSGTSDLSLSQSLVGSGSLYNFSEQERSLLNAGLLASQAA